MHKSTRQFFERVDVDPGQLVGRRLKDVAVVVGLDELAPVAGRERRAEARAVRRGVSGSSGSALGDEGDQLDVAPAVGHSSGNSSPTRDISLAQAIRA